ncbi:MAG: citrate (Si)-synthase, partial [Promicromonosporaceae bacterium]|nr:citrate (Si)-synthase [Promicromonosporaceae bacterium]
MSLPPKPSTGPPPGAAARLIVDERALELPLRRATAGPDALEVAPVHRELGLVGYDPGFVNTASAASAITFIDGERGVLRYRGYPIEALAAGATFLEVAYLLIYGELPSAEALADFSARVNRHTLVPEQFHGFLASFPRGGHPMSMMASAMNALATFYPETLDPHDPDQVDAATVLILAKMRTITSYIHRSTRNESLLYPDYARGYVEDLLRMTFGAAYDPWQENPV